MLALLTTVHRWVGLALALVLVVVSLSGVLLLLRGPYYRWQYPALATPLTAETAAHAPRVLALVEARFGAEVRTVKVPQPGMHVYQVWLADGSEAFVDARSGAVLDRWQPSERLPALLFDLHAHLMSGHRGEVVNGLIALLTIVFLLLGGLLVWWPRRRAMRVRAVWPRAWAAGPLLRSHAAWGVITAAPILLFLGTGAGLALNAWVLPALSRAFDAAPTPVVDVRVGGNPSSRVAWPEVLAGIDGAFADGARDVGAEPPRLVFLTRGRAPESPLVARVRLPGEWHPNGRSLVYLDPATGQRLHAIDARRQGRGTRLGHLLYPVHAARIGGRTSGWLVAAAVLAGLGLATLSLTGVVTWWQRARANSRTHATGGAASPRGALIPVRPQEAHVANRETLRH